MILTTSTEAKTTDPQQRMLLTAAYDALHGDGGALLSANGGAWWGEWDVCAVGLNRFTHSR